MNTEELYETICEWRGVETPWHDCAGLGVKTYATTATWHSGAGGMTPTNGVCNKCWGSGDANSPWPSHRLLLRLHNEKTTSTDSPDTNTHSS